QLLIAVDNVQQGEADSGAQEAVEGVEHGVPVGELDIVGLDLTQNLRREDEQQHDDLQGVRDLNADGALNEGGQGEKKQGKDAEEHVFKVAVEHLGHQGHDHQSAQNEIDGGKAGLGLDLCLQG